MNNWECSCAEQNSQPTIRGVVVVDGQACLRIQSAKAQQLNRLEHRQGCIIYLYVHQQPERTRKQFAPLRTYRILRLESFPFLVAGVMSCRAWSLSLLLDSKVRRGVRINMANQLFCIHVDMGPMCCYILGPQQWMTDLVVDFNYSGPFMFTTASHCQRGGPSN